jgi:hypothetical protein
MGDAEDKRAGLDPEAQPGAEARAGEAGEEEDDTGSPFDHPAFLPVLLWGLALWFGYDGWFNENIEAVNFNRYGFVVLCALAAWFTTQAVRDARRSGGEHPPE